MLGLMQDRPLLISQIIDYAAAAYPDVEIVTRTVEGPIHRYGYKDAHKRAKQLAEALQGLAGAVEIVTQLAHLLAAAAVGVAVAGVAQADHRTGQAAPGTWQHIADLAVQRHQVVGQLAHAGGGRDRQKGLRGKALNVLQVGTVGQQGLETRRLEQRGGMACNFLGSAVDRAGKDGNFHN